MHKHKPMCLVVTLLAQIGAINWGLVGLGMLIGRPINLVNMILGSLPTVEAIVYLVVGVCGLIVLGGFLKTDACGCDKMGK
ncbi:DUF378 domain-containing protein [Candidatus Peregrinibacteria bacterium]|nr:DUF378 domain-containing protein [Candidatus Peregrinibacteria bacterium]